jgi:hypothetical protein
VSKFTKNERATIKSIVATLSIKKIPEVEILKEIERQTSKAVSRRFLCNVKQQIKKDSGKWYSQLREGQFEYIHCFKERIEEIGDLQRRHYEIIDSNSNNASIQQVSLAALHKLNVTLSDYYDILPSSATGHKQTGGVGEGTEGETTYKRMDIIEGCTCRLNDGVAITHSKCLYCLHSWCPKAAGKDWCPNPQCSHVIAGCKFNPYDEVYTWIKCSCGMWFQRQEILQMHLETYPHANSNDNVVND